MKTLITVAAGLFALYLLYSVYVLLPWWRDPHVTTWRHYDYKSLQLDFPEQLPIPTGDLDLRPSVGRSAAPQFAYWASMRGPNRVDFYEAGVVQFGALIDDAMLRQTIPAMLTGFGANMRTKQFQIVSEDAVTNGSLSGREYLVDYSTSYGLFRPHLDARLRVYVQGANLYAAFIATPNSAAFQPIVARFLNSLNIVNTQPIAPQKSAYH